MKYPDPYEGMSDEEVDEELDRLFGEHRAKTVVVSIRMPEELLTRVKRLAEARKTPYQTLLKRVLDSAVSRIEQEGGASAEEPATKRRRHVS
jgi:predicted DNA binding CopG/RHH family protein